MAAVRTPEVCSCLCCWCMDVVAVAVAVAAAVAAAAAAAAGSRPERQAAQLAAADEIGRISGAILQNLNRRKYKKSI